MLLKNKKGQASGVIGTLISAVLGLVVLGLLLVYTSDITQDVSDDQTASTAAFNASQDTLSALTAVSSRTDTLGTIIIVGGIITVLLGVFGGLLRR